MAAGLCSNACRASSSARHAGASSSTPKQACRRLALVTAARRTSSPVSGLDSSSRDRGDGPSLARRELLGAAAALGALLTLQRSASAEGAVPKAYEDTALKLVAALREAISTDLSDAEERDVRRAADPAKNLVRQFLTRWKDDATVEGQESYRQLSKAIQQLGSFYQQNGQRTRLTSAAGQLVLDTLDAAQAALPQRDEKPSLLPFF